MNVNAIVLPQIPDIPNIPVNGWEQNGDIEGVMDIDFVLNNMDAT